MWTKITFRLRFFFIHFLGQSSTLSRSHSIASAGDKSLILSTVVSTSPNTSMHHPGRHGLDISGERLLHELQMSKKQQVSKAQCKNCRIFLSLRFYVKQKLVYLCRASKSAILTNWEALNFDFKKCLHFLKAEIY